ncbi:MAG TPA: ABC-type transport auxiliary lipoprotein family protein [Stellaceae bacterium]|jgi:cholesterol transport system auxiliary component|nr:ABC-type transport auxiliary lipoprotein family protein [Stellaceae bacterium]
MTPPARGIARRWVMAGPVLALAGCASLFVSNPPGKLYRLTPADSYPTPLPSVRAQLLVDLPQAPAGIDTSRIALSRSPISLDYYADAEWTDRLPALVEAALLASFENTGSITAIDRASTGLRADFVLRTEIRHFEAVYDAAGGPPRVWVAIIGRLAAMPRRKIVAQARFEQRVPAAADTVPAVVAAFNTATDAVLKQIVLWTLANPALT